jgi:hypothetical protein
VHLSAFSKELKKLVQSHLVLNQSQVVLRKLVVSREEHSAILLEQEDRIHWDKAHLPSTRGLLTIPSTLGSAYHGLGGKEQWGQP